MEDTPPRDILCHIANFCSRSDRIQWRLVCKDLNMAFRSTLFPNAVFSDVEVSVPWNPVLRIAVVEWSFTTTLDLGKKYMLPFRGIGGKPLPYDRFITSVVSNDDTWVTHYARKVLISKPKDGAHYAKTRVVSAELSERNGAADIRCILSIFDTKEYATEIYNFYNKTVPNIYRPFSDEARSLLNQSIPEISPGPIPANDKVRVYR